MKACQGKGQRTLLLRECVVAAMGKFTQTTKSCGGKGTAAILSRGEHPNPCLDRFFLLFWAHYIEDDPHLLCTGSL